MAYTYNVYGTKQVENATNQYNKVANSAPTYSDSAQTQAARQSADQYAKKYQDSINRGYVSNYSDKINSLAESYQNDKFSWSTEGSRDYASLKDYYQREGAKQQESTQGSYAANTGGYSSSYSQAAGQKVYGQYMDDLAQKIPTLRNSALADWSSRQEQKLNQISMLKGFDDAAYARYRDMVQDNYNFMTYYENKYSTGKGLDMSAFQNELAQWQARMSASLSNLSSIRQLAESQYEHNTVSADTQASISSSRAQNDAYYRYLYSKIK